ncbi:MAG: quorum-sensing autoinducer synthase [Rhodospirillaceae bacterium]|nr:quorum-sensing autoinducer synthase [Rhodospirillaceae bacterium]MBT5525424.1 quorum-sensing autoinducer synthase [Rhodospirillaceae bacterium]MBT5877935.1 quorum-sensing autoinducer synthase [Rhodospirillaceae bacterium]
MTFKQMALSPSIQRYGEFLLRHRILVVVLSVVICLAISSGALHLQTTPDNRVFFGSSNPDLKAFETLEAAYREGNDALIALAPTRGDVFTVETLATVRELTEALWAAPYVTRVDSIANFQHSQVSGDELIIDNLIPLDLALTEPAIADIRTVALTEPALGGLLISRDGHVTGIAVNFRLPEKSPEAIREIVAHLRELEKNIEARHLNINIYMTGNIMLMSAFDEASLDDLSTLIPAMFVAIVVVMVLLVRSFAGMAAVMLLASLSSMTAMGVAGWFGVVINAGSSSAPLIIMTMALAYGVHLVTKFLADFGSGWTKREAIINSVEFNLSPVSLTSVTSAIGFLSMNGSDAPPFHDLGTIVAVGVTTAFILSFTFVPAFLGIMRIAKPRRRVFGQRLTISLGSFVVSNRRWVFWTMSALIVLLATGISRIELNDDWVGYFDKRYEFRHDTEFILENLTGIDLLEYSVAAKGEQGIYEPSYLKMLDQFTTWLRQQPEVVNVQSLSDVMKRLNRDLNGGVETAYKLPQERELAAQYLLLYEMSLPRGLDLNDRVKIDRSGSRVSVMLRRDGANLPSKDLRPLAMRIDTWLARNGDTAQGAKGSSISLMFAYLSERNISAMLVSTAIALLLISAILVLALRSIKIGIASLVPNFVPAIMGFGLWGYLQGEVGVAVSVVAAMTFGIVVDDTIHFLSKYLQGRRELGKGPEEAILYSFRSVGTALLVTTMVLVAGFLVLATSGFKVSSSLGLLTAIVLALALVADFLFLPSLLLQFDRVAKDVAGDLDVLADATHSIELPGLTQRVLKYLDRIRDGHPLRGKPPGEGAIELWSNDYLSIAGHRSIVNAQSDLLRGNREKPFMSAALLANNPQQRSVETKLAAFLGVEDAVLCQSGWCANIDLLQTIADESTPIYLDIYVHASLWEGARMSKAPIHPFRHNQPDSLAAKAKRHGPGIVVVDAVYSANGSVCPMLEIVEVAEQYGCLLVVDESHSVGTYGEYGEGLVATLGLTDRVHYRTLSLSKAFATRAGLVAGPSRVMDFFRHEARSMLFSSAILPYEIAGLQATLEVIQTEGWRREKLWQRTVYLRRRLTELGYNVDESDSQVVALEAGPEYRSMQLRDALESAGIFGAVFCAPATPQNRSLIRLSINAALTDAQVERIIRVCADVRDAVELETWPSSMRRRKRHKPDRDEVFAT